MNPYPIAFTAAGSRKLVLPARRWRAGSNPHRYSRMPWGILLGLCLATGVVAAQSVESSAPSNWQGPDTPSQATDERGVEPMQVVRSLRVTGSALRPRDSGNSVDVSAAGGCTYNSGGSAFGVLNTPLQLRDGTEILSLRMYYSDTSASNSIGWFTIYDLYGAIVTEFPVSSSGNFGNSFNDSAAINHVVNNSVYAYALNWRPNVAGTQMQLCGFRIFLFEPPDIFRNGFESG
ncbi:MAG TPA: hypothetical protein PKZ76_01740 [Xanthomonadaceae bacterium]|nr:hypothetical protein [Xanthomonadaceae bacterium]